MKEESGVGTNRAVGDREVAVDARNTSVAYGCGNKRYTTWQSGRGSPPTTFVDVVSFHVTVVVVVVVVVPVAGTRSLQFFHPGDREKM